MSRSHASGDRVDGRVGYCDKDVLIPATVGVDIGCGMMAVKTPFKSGILDRNMAEFRHEIERAIPVGFNDYKEPVDESNALEG